VESELKAETAVADRMVVYREMRIETMPVISKFYGIIVRLLQLPGRRMAIYANYGEQELVMDATTLRVISGNAPERVVDMVIEWAQQHHAELMQVVEGGDMSRSPVHIAPLY